MGGGKEETMTNEEIVKSLATIGTRLDGIEETLNKIEKALNGNGQPGLISRVTTLEAKDSTKSKTVEWFVLIATAITSAYAAFFRHGN